jgi:hypothetical protein
VGSREAIRKEFLTPEGGGESFLAFKSPYFFAKLQNGD